MQVLGDRAVDLLRGAGAAVDRETRTVRLDPGQVEELVALAPSLFTLRARNPERDVAFGGGEPRVLRGRRAGLRDRTSTAADGPATSPTSAITCA